MPATVRGQPDARRPVSPAVAPPPGNPRFALFDSLRAIAVLSVLAFHVSTLTGDLNKRGLGDVLGLLGNQGLVLFFVISGFLLYRPFVAAHAGGRPRPSTRKFARRRVLRIVPAYWAALTVLAIYPGISSIFSHDWWRYYLFLQVYSQRTVTQGIPTAWTLCVEVSFYLLLPLWAMFVRATARRLRDGSWLRSELFCLGLLALLGIGIQVAKSRLAVSTTLDSTLLGECVWFALGMGLAVASVRIDEADRAPAALRLLRDRPGLCWLGSLACLLGAAAVLQPHGPNIALSLQAVQPLGRTLGGIVLTGGVAVLLVAPAVFGEDASGWPRRVLAWRPLMLLGVISYGVYLYHLTVAEVVGQPASASPFSSGAGLGLVGRVAHLTTPVLLVVTLAVTVVLATASYRLVELPFLRRKETG
jgi:peptidoglycan/LPS O-acetylase OafA/YrhL